MRRNELLEGSVAIRSSDASEYYRTAVRFLGNLVGLICVIALSAMTLITMTDVLGRYLFNSPIKGADEVIVITLAATVFAGLPLAIAHRGMIAVEVLLVAMSQKMQMAARAVSDIVSSVFLVFCAWQLVRIANRLASHSEATMFLRIPTAPVAWGIAFALCLSAITFLGLAAAPMFASRQAESDWKAKT